MSATEGGIYIALGANLPSDHGSPQKTLEAAAAMLVEKGIVIRRRSSWWRSSPQPASDQPDFINGIFEIETSLPPDELLQLLHHVEAAFGRVRRQRWEARVLDLDLIDYCGRVSGAPAAAILPHPRLQDRLFVLLPLQEIAPNWRHPATGAGLETLISRAMPLNINRLM